MAALIVQTGVRNGRVAEITKSTNDRLSVGRGFENDLVLIDPYIAANQICFSQREGQWFIDILDDKNPVLINGQVIVDNTQVQSGDKLRVGRTSLVLYFDDHEVESTRKLLLSGWLHHDNVGLLLPSLILLGVCLLGGLIDTLQVSTVYEWKEYTFFTLVSALMIVAWAAVWSITGRLLRHEHHFSSQLLITSVAAGLYTLLEPLANYAEYFSSSETVGELVAYFLGLVVFSGLLKFNVMFATNIIKSTFTGLIASFGIVIFFYVMASFEQAEQANEPQFSSVLKAPFAHITSDDSIDEYFENLEEKFDQLKLESDSQK